MRISPIAVTTNYVRPAFNANFSPVSHVQPQTINKGQAVLSYIEQGCPKTERGEYIFNKLFVPEIFDLNRVSTPVEKLLERCGDNVEVIDRALGKYGLELYGNLPKGSTTKTAHEGIAETGYWSKYDDLNTNFLNYLDYNPSGTLSELEERFGQHASLWLDIPEAMGQIRTDFSSYRVIDDLGDTSSIKIKAETLRANAVRRYLDNHYC